MSNESIAMNSKKSTSTNVAFMFEVFQLVFYDPQSLYRLPNRKARNTRVEQHFVWSLVCIFPKSSYFALGLHSITQISLYTCPSDSSIR